MKQETELTKAALYCDIFSYRASDSDTSPLWRCFLRGQMLNYLLSKNNFSLETQEGDMIYDLIRDTYLEMYDFIEESLDEAKSLASIIRSVHIDFPKVERMRISDEIYGLI